MTELMREVRAYLEEKNSSLQKQYNPKIAA